jgi:hypothetical protein
MWVVMHVNESSVRAFRANISIVRSRAIAAQYTLNYMIPQVSSDISDSAPGISSTEPYVTIRAEWHSTASRSCSQPRVFTVNVCNRSALAVVAGPKCRDMPSVDDP